MNNPAIILRLAWRNVWRNTRRTVLTLLTIVVGCAMIILMSAIAKGGHDRMIEAVVQLPCRIFNFGDHTTLTDVTVNNPVAIVDRETGDVHFVYCIEYARCFWMVSHDDGLTFSEPVEITTTFEQLRKAVEYVQQRLSGKTGDG